MSNSLYPLKFVTIFKDKIWGGNKIHTYLGKDFAPLPNCGETWEVSGVPGNVSVVKEGSEKGKTLSEMIETYQEKLVGKKVFERFGKDFPLLIKFIDANDDLSIQVHPDDTLAKARHNSFGKTEMWYILQADPQARLNSGFNQVVTKESYLSHLESNTLEEILNFEEVKAGDVFFLPAGRVHYIGKGILLAEIQQTSDVTYRIYDFDRKDDQGSLRELHTELALDAIDFTLHEDYKTSYATALNQPVNVVSSKYFITNLLQMEKSIIRDYSSQDSFVIFIVLQGTCDFQYSGGSVTAKLGECLLLPAEITSITLLPFQSAKVLEVYIP